MDTEALEALRQSTPQGDITDPSSWNLGENPSLEGYTLLAANVFGSLLPVVLASAGGPLSAMAVGGAQGAGAATDQAREIVWQAFDEGTLADSSAYYNSLLQAGFSEQEAARRTADAAGQLAGQMTLPVSALGGLATERILSGVTSRVAGGPLAARMVGGAVVGAAEEGTQEAAEGVTARVGVNVGAQGPLTNPTEETFGDFLMGAIGGAPVGMAGGARSPGVPRGADDDLLDEQLPPEAQPAPAPSSPMGPQEAGPAGVSPVGPPPTTPPQGPLSTAAARAPDRGVGGLEAGQPVTIYSPETGNTHQAEFIGETAEGVVVRVGEQEFVFDDEMLAAGIEIRDATGAMPVPQPTQMPDPRSEALGYDQTAINEDQGRYDEPTAAEQSIEAMIAARWEERGNQITEDIQRDLQRIADEARSQNIRATLDSFVNRRLAELEQQRDAAMTDVAAGAIEEGDVTRNDGQPFPSQEVALRAMQNRGLDMRDYQMMQVDGGVVLRPLQQPLPSPNDPNAYPRWPQPDDDAPGPGWPQEEDRAPAPQPDAGMVAPEVAAPPPRPRSQYAMTNEQVAARLEYTATEAAELANPHAAAAQPGEP
jgi:hypothetical protein